MIGWIIAALVAFLLILSPIMGFLSSPWAGFWFGQRNAIPPALVIDSNETARQAADPLDLSTVRGAVSDVQRFQLARQAGWNVEDAIIATAISIAENGTGEPGRISGKNDNGTYDLGLWQINSSWWPQFGGRDALVDPWRNAQAAYYIKGRQGWCAWSTYLASCGIGHTGSYASFLGRARSASQAQPGPIG